MYYELWHKGNNYFINTQQKQLKNIKIENIYKNTAKKR